MKASVLIAAVAAVVPALALAQAASGVAPPQQNAAPASAPASVAAVAGQRLFGAGGVVMLSGTGSILATPAYLHGNDPFDHALDLGGKVASDAFGTASAAQLFGAFDRHEAALDQARARASDDGRLARNASFVGAGASDDYASFFGLAATGLTPAAARGDGKFNAPYYAMVHDARHAGLSMAVGEHSRLRLGLLYEGATGSDVLPTLSPYARRTLVSAELEQRVGRAVGVLSVGMLRESGSLLGSLQGSALALNTAARTSFASFSLGYALAPQLSLVGMASAGHTAGFRNADSLVTQVSSVGTVAYSVGLAARQLFDSRDRFGLTLTVPTKVTDGALSLAGALVQREDGALSYVNRTLNLAPSATERDLEMTYSRPLADAAKLSAALMLRVHPGHDASSPRDLLLGLRYGRKF